MDIVDPATTSKHAVEAFSTLSETLRCPCCHANSVTHCSDYPSETEPFASQKILFCTKCGTGYVPGSKELLDGYYSENYATQNRRDRSAEPKRYFSEAFRNRSPKLQRYFGRANRQLSLLGDLGCYPKSLLDFGSGPGYLLHLSNASKKFAFEPDLHSKKYLDFIGAKTFKNLSDIPKNRFDAIVASHSIEHLVPEDLISTIEILLHALKRDGILLIEVPQGGHSYLYPDSRQDPHTLFFTPEGIAASVARAGGDIIWRKAMSKGTCPVRPDAIYKPGKNAFFKEVRGSLTLACRRKETFSEKIRSLF